MGQKFWDEMSKEYFDTHKNEDEVELEAEENFIFAWPVIKKFISDHFKETNKKRALDFGCGAGKICSELYSMGFDTTGIDYSEGMINTAKKNLDKNINLFIGKSGKSLEIANRDGKFDLIVSILVFPFIKNIEKTLNNLSKSLNNGGYICFVAFNKGWVKEALIKGIDYKQPIGTEGIKKLIMDFGANGQTDVFHRSPKEYNQIMKKLGYKKLIEEYPLFTEDFISKVYPGMPKKISEFMILGYQKTA